MTISALRLSFIFTETILDLQRGAGGVMPLGSFVTKPGYTDTVDALRQGGTAPLELGLPWPYPVGQHFWDAYLHDKQPGDAAGKLCFEKLVPLRLPKLFKKIETELPNAPAATVARVGIEGFYYPHGTGLLVTTALEGAFDAAMAGGLALRLRYEKVYRPTMSPAGPAASLNLEQLATYALNRLRELGFGSGVSGKRSDLFSIATIVRGDNVDPTQPLAPDGQTHRLLNGLAAWIHPWQQLQAPALQAGESQLYVKTATAWPGNVLFAAKRGRAVWFPGLFLPAPSPLHKLACYHRNLGLASLQADSLLMLAAAVEDAFAQPALVPNAIQELGRLAGGLLARLHSGTKTYRSDSLRAQIAQSEQLQDVNTLRQRFGMDPIL